MKNLRVAIACALSIFLASQTITAAHAQTKKAWSSSSIPAVANDEIQALFGTTVFTASSDLNWSVRTTPTPAGAKLSFNRPRIYYALPPCSSLIKSGCIASVDYSLDSNTWKAAVLSSRELVKRNGEVSVNGRLSTGEVISTREFNEWVAEPESHTPAAGRASYWHFPGAPHGGGDEYLLRANVSGINSSQSTWSNGKVQRYLEMGIFPVDGLSEYEFPANVKIRVRLNLGIVINDLWGWFHGRVINPDVVMDLDSALGVLEVSGAPSFTPMGLTKSKKISDLSANMNLFGCDGQPGINTCPPKPGLKQFSTDGNADLSFFSAFEKEFKEVSTTGVRTEWWIETTRWPNDALIDNCPAPQNGFAGIVTTNASMYKPSAPSWDSTDNSFVFQVASPHRGLTGELNQGYYSLILPLDLAQCRWGRQLANAKAVVSITSDDGANQVGVATYKISKNLLIFNISGFNYSSPKIKVSLAPSPQIVAPSPQPNEEKVSSLPKPAVPKKKTIVCTNGKQLKKVTAISPKCPIGYKKK